MYDGASPDYETKMTPMNGNDRANLFGSCKTLNNRKLFSLADTGINWLNVSNGMSLSYVKIILLTVGVCFLAGLIAVVTILVNIYAKTRLGCKALTNSSSNNSTTIGTLSARQDGNIMTTSQIIVTSANQMEISLNSTTNSSQEEFESSIFSGHTMVNTTSNNSIGHHSGLVHPSLVHNDTSATRYNQTDNLDQMKISSFEDASKINKKREQQHENNCFFLHESDVVQSDSKFSNYFECEQQVEMRLRGAASSRRTAQSVKQQNANRRQSKADPIDLDHNSNFFRMALNWQPSYLQFKSVIDELSDISLMKSNQQAENMNHHEYSSYPSTINGIYLSSSNFLSSVTTNNSTESNGICNQAQLASHHNESSSLASSAKSTSTEASKSRKSSATSTNLNGVKLDSNGVDFENQTFV